MGFALESFDPIGVWRREYPGRGKRRAVVDPTGQLASGETFADFAEFKRLLVDKRGDQIRRHLATTLIEYSAGRRLGAADRSVVEEVITRTRHRGDGLRTLVREALSSSPVTGI